MADVYMTIESAQRYGTPIDALVPGSIPTAGPDGILGNADDTSIPITAGQFNERDATMAETGTTKLFTDELRQNRLPGSEIEEGKRHATHTVKFVEIPNSRFDPIGTSPATPGVRNHLYIGFHNQQTSLGTDDDDVNHRLILGTHYPAPTDAEMHPSTVGETNEYKYDPTAPDSKMQYIWDPKAIHTKVALQMRGMDVLIADPASAQWRDTVPTVFMLTNGGTILEIKPALLEDTANLLLLYDASDGSSSKPSLDQFTPGPYAVRVGLLRTDGTTKDLTNDWKAVEGVMRDADYTGGLVVVADFDGDTYPDVLSGRHISSTSPLPAQATLARTWDSAASTTPSHWSGGLLASRLRP